MIKTINQYFRQYVQNLPARQKEKEILLTVKSINIFLKFLHTSYKDKFWSQLDPELQKNRHALRNRRYSPLQKKRLQKEIDDFCELLSKKYQSYFKIFLSRDAYLFYKEYSRRSKKHDAIEILYTRKKALGGRNNSPYYLYLSNLSYQNEPLRKNLREFKNRYMSNLKKDTLYKTIVTNTHEILYNAKVFERIKSGKKILLIDSGIQGGLILPLLTYLRDLGIDTDFYLYTCVSWIYPLFKNNVFTKDISLLELLERQSVMLYEKNH